MLLNGLVVFAPLTTCSVAELWPGTLPQGWNIKIRCLGYIPFPLRTRPPSPSLEEQLASLLAYGFPFQSMLSEMISSQVNAYFYSLSYSSRKFVVSVAVSG